MKKILSIILTVLMIVTMMPFTLPAKAAASIPVGETIYLKPGSYWSKDEARFAAYIFGDGYCWVDLEAVPENDGYYQFTVPEGTWNGFLFCRMVPGTANSWENKWNQTSDLSYDGVNNLYSIAENSDAWYGMGTWSQWGADEEEESDTITLYLVNVGGWEAPHCYYWNNGTYGVDYPFYPGEEMEFYGNDGRYDIYTYKIPVEGLVGFFFISGDCSSQTREIYSESLENGTIFDTDANVLTDYCVGHEWNNGVCDICKKACDHAELDEAAKCIVCGKICYMITRQPSVYDLSVEVNVTEGTTYQWIKKSERKEKEITDKNAIGVGTSPTNTDVTADYESDRGWISASSYGGYSPVVNLYCKEGDIIRIPAEGSVTKACISDSFDSYRFDTYEYETAQEDGNIYIEIENEGYYYIIVDIVRGEFFKAYITTDGEFEEIDGATDCIYLAKAVGEYYCVVRFADGTEVNSDTVVVTTIHTCDFTGEWKYDSEKHWKECECGLTDEEADHSYTDGKCDCGYDCPHEETYETVTKPEHYATQNADGTWTKAVISVACKNCYEILEEKEADRADYTEFDEILEKICEYLDSGKLIDNAYNGYISTINNIKNNPYIIGSPFQSTPDGYIEELNCMLSEIEAGIADGSMIKADFTYMTALFDEINALIDSDPNKLTPDAGGMYRGIYNGYYVPQSKNNNHSQESYNLNGKYYETQLENLLAAIKDGSKLKADYTEIDEAIADIDEKLNDADLTDEANTELEDIRAQLEAMKKNPLSSKKDAEDLMDAVEELDEAIEDGTIVLVDAYKILEEYDIARSDDLEEKYGREKVGVVFLKIHRKNPGVIESIWEYAESITGTVAETADEIEELKARVDALYAAIERCIIGTHNVEEYEVVSPAKCGTNAIESGTCTFCCDVITREVENSALKHSFTKYEEVEAPKCGVAGKEVAYCDNGCGETDEKAIAALKHSFTKYEVTEEAKCDVEGKEVAYCDNGCGATDEKAIEALKHSFTKYKVTEEAKCDVEGKEVAYCDNGCGATDKKEIETLEHLFLDYIYNDDATCTEDGTKTAVCLNGCGETDTVTAEDTMLEHADEDGDKICDDCESEIEQICPDCGGKVHANTGIPEYICLIVTFIKLVVSLAKALGLIA